MSFAVYPALVFSVAMLVTSGYFLVGGLPLLILQHDTPLDARFVRRFFDIYFMGACATSLGACVSFALWGKLGFALGAAALLLVATVLRRVLIPTMHRLGEQIQGNAEIAIPAFRRMHLLVLGVNLLQLVVVVWGLVKLSW